MVRIDPYKPDENKVREGYKRLMKEKHDTAYGTIPGYGVYQIPGGYKSKLDDYTRSHKPESYATTTDMWINPSHVTKIECMTDRVTDDNFLKVYMSDGSIYYSKESTVEEFFMKNMLEGEKI